MPKINIIADVDVDRLAEQIVWGDGFGADKVLDFIKALDCSVGDWDFTKRIRDWAKAEIKEAKRLGYTS